MWITIPRSYWKAFGVVFTTILAPLSVHQLVGGDDNPSQEPRIAETSVVTSQELTPSTTRIVARGSGSTPEAAFQNAIEAAMQQSIAAEVSTEDWNLHGQKYLTLLRHNGNGILRGWRELSGSSERHLSGRLYHSDVAVEVDGEALRERLHLARNDISP
ncbi:hypothetical protein [Fimbriiglobus ruber]|uniref:hypothetical protein n=1 Tax=Fimbriiglobus ruber TaxID=1908690 RepID=UPI00117ABC43|nr:hypothetical protein [Fimbriiglobus ruber]